VNLPGKYLAEADVEDAFARLMEKGVVVKDSGGLFRSTMRWREVAPENGTGGQVGESLLRERGTERE
jgi:hypothetical protein